MEPYSRIDHSCSDDEDGEEVDEEYEEEEDDSDVEEASEESNLMGPQAKAHLDARKRYIKAQLVVCSMLLN